MRTKLGVLALAGALVLPATVIVPSASAEGQCRSGYTLYDTGAPGAFREDRNLNGLVCDKTKAVGDNFRHWYTDDR